MKWCGMFDEGSKVSSLGPYPYQWTWYCSPFPDKFILSVSGKGCCVMSRFLAVKQALVVLKTDECCSIYQNGICYYIFVNSEDVILYVKYFERSYRARQ